MPSAPTCRCGHPFNHHMVSPEGEHGAIGWLLMLVGATPTPKRIRYRCRDCGDVIMVSEDPKVRREFL